MKFCIVPNILLDSEIEGNKLTDGRFLYMAYCSDELYDNIPKTVDIDSGIMRIRTDTQVILESPSIALAYRIFDELGKTIRKHTSHSELSYEVASSNKITISVVCEGYEFELETITKGV